MDAIPTAAIVYWIAISAAMTLLAPLGARFEIWNMRQFQLPVDDTQRPDMTRLIRTLGTLAMLFGLLFLALKLAL